MNDEKVVRTGVQVQPIEPDSVRIGIKENAIQLEFGQFESSAEEHNDVIITSIIRLNPKYLQQFMLKIAEAGVEYEKKFDADVGFHTFWKSGGE